MASFVHRVWNALSHAWCRRREIRMLRRRLRTLPALHPQQATLAGEMRDLRVALGQRLRGAQACSSCARKMPLPYGRWSGGSCCGTSTNSVFSDVEVTALGLSATRPRDLQRYWGDQAGCAFRGPLGCTLSVAHRPNVCMRYACNALRQELRARGDWREVQVLSDQLAARFRAFERLLASTQPEPPI